MNLDELTKAVIEGDSDMATELTMKALKVNIPAQKILTEGLIPGIHKVGDLFGAGEYFLPELLVSGEAMSTAVEILEPELAKSDVPPKGRFLIGTVQGDVHDIGKNIVIMMMKGNGWEVTDLGVDVTPEAFCSAVKEGDYDILGLSALLTMTMPALVQTLEGLKAVDLRDKVKVIVGGAPITQEWADKAGFDGYASDASEAVKVAASLVEKS
ncbi:MAG: corrinoid protein [Chloroflexota bacterium]|nr:corrinoid protein [Chloroflexota bacterium]